MEELYETLESLGNGAGEFACSGRLPELGYPGLHIKDVGYISLPVQDEQAQKIIEVAKKAPYGLGSQTLVDETVRKTWQLEPNQISIKSEHFLIGVKNVVTAVKKHLGCDNKAVQANLYKLLIYEKGGHFKPHRDTQKENGMFATMIIQLPSQFEGGKLTIRHAGKEKVVNFDGEESIFCCKYAAFYCDCEHEVSEVISGFRIALVYSLCWSETSNPPSADSGVAIIETIVQLVGEIFKDEDRSLFLWFLYHKYTISDLSRNGINALKGADEAVARALLLANERLPEEQQLEFHIVEVIRELDHDGYLDEYGSGEFEIDHDVDGEESIKIDTWYKFDGSERRVGSVHFDIDNDVLNFSCPTDMTKEEYMEEIWGEAYNTEYHGPTGNAGASQTYWYKTYAIVAWPKVQSIRIICTKGSYGAAVNCVFDQVKQIKDLSSSNPSYGSALNDLKTVIDFGISHRVSLYESEASTVLKTLATLSSEACEAVSLASLFLVKVMTKTSDFRSPYCLGNDEVVLPLVQLTQAIGWPSMQKSLREMFKMSPISQHFRWAKFLMKLYEEVKDDLGKDIFFKSIVTCLVEKFETEVRDNQLDPGSANVRAQSIAALLFLLGNEELLEKFTSAVCVYSRRSPKSSVLQKLVQSLKNGNLGDNPFWIQLLVRRIQQLEEIEKVGIRPFSWNQKDAVVVGHPQVESFLRGPRTKMRYEAFNGIGHARNWMYKHFHRIPETSPYSAKVTVGGRGRDAYALIEKTRDWYDRKVNTIKQQLSELKMLRAMVTSRPVAGAASSSGDQMEHQAKKRARLKV